MLIRAFRSYGYHGDDGQVRKLDERINVSSDLTRVLGVS